MALMGKKSRMGLAMIAVLLASALSGCKKQNEPAKPPQPKAGEPNAQAAAQPSGQANVGKDIRILYVGHPGSDREKDFVEFLSKHFGTVAKGDLAAFAESKSKGFDVTILDYDGDGFKAPLPELSPEFSRPVVTIGVAGGLLSSSLHLKTGYM